MSPNFLFDPAAIFIALINQMVALSMPELRFSRTFSGRLWGRIGWGLRKNRVNLADCRKCVGLPVELYGVALYNGISLPKPRISRINGMACGAIRIQLVSRDPARAGRKVDELAATRRAFDSGHSSRRPNFVRSLVEDGAARRRP